MQVQADLDRLDIGSAFRSRAFWQRVLSHRSLPLSRTLGIVGLTVAGLLFVTALVAYLTDAIVHPGFVLNWYDLNVYEDAGLITRQLPSYLYIWQLSSNIKFTYTPFAAVMFAGGSYLSWASLRWLMTLASIAAIPLTAWLTLGAMGRRGTSRICVTMVVGALGLWTEPVTKALFLGQIEPLLLLLCVWDLTRDDSRSWKGIGIGLAAGIKLVPMLFIPYLLVAGKYRQAVVATATFALTMGIGFAVLPGPSTSYWLSGYFFKPGRTGGVDALVNQSLLGMLARHAGSGPAAMSLWLPIAGVVALLGIGGGAMLARAGMEVQGWVLVGVTGVLVSPISWDHHWVWVIPLLAMLAGLAMNAGAVARWGWVVLGAAVFLMYGAWPWMYSGPNAFIPQRGLIGWFVQAPSKVPLNTLHGWQLLTWNIYVIAGLVVFLVMLTASAFTWRRQPELPAPPGSRSSPIDALLARADAVLKAAESR